jgi:hypothetical protein
MRLSQMSDVKRIVMGLALFALLAFGVGCDSSGGGGESTATPSTPPPGRSAKDQGAARDGAYKAPGAAGNPSPSKPN